MYDPLAGGEPRSNQCATGQISPNPIETISPQACVDLRRDAGHSIEDTLDHLRSTN